MIRARNVALLVIGTVLVLGSTLLVHWRYALHLDTPPLADSMVEDTLPSTTVNILQDAWLAGFFMFSAGGILAIADGVKYLARRP